MLRHSAHLKGLIRHLGTCSFVGLGCLLGLALMRGIAAETPPASAEGLKFYAQEVRPILAANCFKCHSHEAKKAKGGLVVDSLGGLLKGGESGPAIVPGAPDKSLLIRAVRHIDDELKMPAGGKKLSDEQIDRLARWVKMGAPAPGADKTVKAARGKITDEDRAWWAFQPVRKPPVPMVADDGWSRGAIDRFVFEKLAAEGLRPAPEAERAALCRRVTFDLIGLPPTPAEVDAFLADQAPDAYERLVDRLLASPRYGERWARHWLDLVRYADSDGFRLDEYRPNAWRYRDYVIRAFNEDKPYNLFVTEQLAGDEIAPEDPEALAATAFLRHTMYEYNQVDARTQWSDMLNDLTDVTGDVFLGLGMGCARCHDHKFDPILQKDYYRLQAFFAAFLPRDDVPLATPGQRAEYQARLAKWQAQTADLRKQIAAIEAPARQAGTRRGLKRFPPDIQAILGKGQSVRTPLEEQLYQLAYRQIAFEYTRVETRMKDEEKHKVAALRRQLADFDSVKPAPLPAGMTVTDVGPVAPPTFIPKKANQTSIEPGFPEVMRAKPAVIVPVPAAPHSTGRRTALARWLTRPDHPLTTRVIVNRIWQYHFGRGLVATTSDFGRLGEKPSHPELLDWLAVRFVEDGWSLKKMHKLILTSATYRQSAVATAPASALQKDPENRLLGRGSTRRLDAEQIRDAMLAATGELDLQMGGPGVEASKPRRSIYTKVLHNIHDPLLDVFDAPEGFTSTAQRNVTTTPTQALLLFNGQQLQQRARAFAQRLARDCPRGESEQIASAYRLAYGRPPEPTEGDRALGFVKDQAGRIDPRGSSGPGFLTEKMPYREGKAAVLQPGGAQNRLHVADSPDLPTGTFTIEAFVLLRSLNDDGTARTIASYWSGDKKQPGWSFGVTSKKSAYKPQTLVLQFWTGKGQGGKEYEAVFSGLHVAMHKPYYVAAAVDLQNPDKAGITFYAKDMANDEEPMQVAHAAHQITGMGRPRARFTIGGTDQKPWGTWDGLMDGLRLSDQVLRPDQLMLTNESVTDHTVGFWRFEPRPSPYRDATGHGHEILPIEVPSARGVADREAAALVDFCHALLNSNEFIYVD